MVTTSGGMTPDYTGYDDGSEKQLLREDLPSSGLRDCVEHKWTVAEHRNDTVVLACSKCGKTMLSKPEIKSESKEEGKKKLLMEEEKDGIDHA